MKKYILLFALLVSTLLISYASITLVRHYVNTPKPYVLKPTYAANFKAVSRMANVYGRYTDAMNACDMIIKKAIAENNQPEIIKAITFKLVYSQYVDEQSLVKALYELQALLPKVNSPGKQVLHSILADGYWHYYQTNRGQFINRSQTVSFKNDDIRTWDLTKILTECVTQYNLSLSNVRTLQSTPINAFKVIMLNSDKAEATKYRPTLYDVLAFRAINFFENGEVRVIKPLETFNINDARYLSNTTEFLAQTIASTDVLSFDYQLAKHLQNLIKFNATQQHIIPLIDADLKRIAVMYAKNTTPNKDSLYLRAMKHIATTYANAPYAQLANYHIAQWYLARFNDDKNKTYKKIAVDIAKQSITKCTDANIIAKFKNIITSAENETIAITIENVNLPNQPFIAKINYTNSTNINFRVVKMDMVEYRKQVNLSRIKDTLGRLLNPEAYRNYIYNLPTVSEWTETLPDDKLYLNNSLLYKMPAINNAGLYAIIISNNNNTKAYKPTTCEYAITQLSALGILNTIDYKNYSTAGFIVSRNNNVPIANVQVNLFTARNVHHSKGYWDETIYETKYTTTSATDGSYAIDSLKNNVTYTYHLKTTDDEFYTNVSFELPKYDARNYNYTNNYKEPDYTNYYTTFFTDRAIYRPTQTIHVKGLVTKTHNHNTQLHTCQKATITLYDANYQKVESKELTTNEFGTYYTTFIAPNKGLNGIMYITDNYGGSTTVRVEEYKRPLFEITPKPVTKIYTLNDTVLVHGLAMSYSSAPIIGAKVAYHITRSASTPYWWRCYNPWYSGNGTTTEMYNGTSTTNDTGAYIIKFKAVPDASLVKQSAATFNYTIYTTITDINGETHTTQQNITVGYVTSGFNMVSDAAILIKQNRITDSLHVTLSTYNFNGTHNAQDVKLKITKLKSPNKFYRASSINNTKCNKYMYSQTEWEQWFSEDEYNEEKNYLLWKEDQIMHSSTVKTLALNHKLNFNCSTWLNGKYKIEATSYDNEHNLLKEINYLDITNLNDIKTAQTQLVIIPTSTTQHNSYALLSPHITTCFKTTSAHDVIAYTHLHTTINNFTTNVTTANGLEVYSYYHNNRYYSVTGSFNPIIEKTINEQQAEIKTNSTINLSLLTLRDKLQPGAKEQWKLKLSSTDKTIPLAELVATMYDASLDKFVPHNFSTVGVERVAKPVTQPVKQVKSNNIKITERPNFSWTINADHVAVLKLSKTNALKNYGENIYPYLNLFGLTWQYQGWTTVYDYEMNSSVNTSIKSEATASPIKSVSKQDYESGDAKYYHSNTYTMIDEATPSIDNSLPTSALSPPTPPELPKEEITVRKNKNETAFFFPQITNDANGDFTLDFTMSEALTRWRMLAFAHTYDLKQAQLTHNVITQKELMVVPNWPRFVREDDSITIVAKIVNLTNTPLKGKAYIELINPLTNQKINYVQGVTQHAFEVGSANNTSVAFTLHINALKDALQATIYASTATHSDAEQTTLPVLPNRVLVTESMPMPIRSNQVKTFTFDKLIHNVSNTLTHYNYSVEFTQNPAWLAIKALPYLSSAQFDCADGLANKFFANSLSSYIVNSSPVIENVFKQWQQDPEALLSPLEKNQELKSALLQETPWVLASQAETQQRKDVGKFFEKEKLKTELTTTYKKLYELQKENGAFLWWKGDTSSSPFLTQQVLFTFARLIHNKVITKNSYEQQTLMMQKAIVFLDNALLKSYKQIQKNQNCYTVNYTDALMIQYLYMRTILVNQGFALPFKYQEMFNYHIAQTQMYWLQHTRYTQAIAALTLHYNKDATTPKTILASLKNNSINSEEMGAYWKDTYEYFDWYQQPIEAQAMTINAFSELTTDKKFIDDMKTWLLKSKQTQQWPSSSATVEAVYALLLSDANSMSNWLSTDNSIVVKTGNITIDPAKNKTIKTESGTGYFKKQFKETEIQNNMGAVSVSKNNEGVSWGAAYWQYFERLDKITQHHTGLSIKKELFVVINTPTGPVIKPIDKQPLKIGDKIKVRVEIRADRSFSYLHLKDMRAAGFEPVNVLSQYKYQDGLGYYESTRDAATHFFFNYLGKGTHVFEYSVYATHAGTFNNGITTMQCFYAPEFTTHSQGNVVTVK